MFIDAVSTLRKQCCISVDDALFHSKLIAKLEAAIGGVL